MTPQATRARGQGDLPHVPATAKLVLLSGGLDSAVALAGLDTECETVFVDYGQAAREEERRAAQAIAEHYRARHRELALRGLEIGAGEIRGRNAMLLLVALMSSREAATLVLGIHPGSPYWDCSGDFLVAMQRVIDGYAGGSVQVLAPLVDLSKEDILRLAVDLSVPIALTYSCELADGPCGRCRSCRDIPADAR